MSVSLELPEPPMHRVFPDLETDLSIIANVRASLIGLPATPENRRSISPFTCGPRCYLIDDTGVVAVLTFDVHDELDAVLLALLPHCKPPLEYWFLEDDQVVQHGETDEADIADAAAWHAARA